MTTLMLRKLRELNSQGLNDRQVGEILGLSGKTIGAWRRRLKIEATYTVQKNPYVIYYIYDGKTTQLLAFGSAEECARTLGLRVQTIYAIHHRFTTGKSDKYTVVTERNKGGATA